MAIGMIEFQGQIQRTQDFSNLKHQDNMKSFVDQSNYQNQNDKRVDEKINQVVKKDDSSKSNNHSDASEEGKNKYAGDGGQHRKKQEVPVSGKVVLKGQSHFDASI